MKAVRLLILVCALAGAAGGGAEARSIALVIGNNAYQNLEPLKKAVGDAETFSALLTDKGFDRVFLKEDLTRQGIDEALAEFLPEIGPGDTAVFVYSGHGWSNGEQNFLVGVDAPARGSEEFLTRISIPLRNGVNGVLDEIERRGAGLKVAVVDACRDNPFRPALGGKSIGLGRGLTRLRESAPAGTFIVFSAGAGQVALDRLANNDAHPNSVFTRVLVPLLRSDMPLLSATKKAQQEVAALAASVGHEQQPAYYDEVQGLPCISGICVASFPGGDTAAPANLGEVIEGKVAAAVTDEAVRRAYETEIAAFEPSEEVKVSHILVATQAEAQAIIDQLESGGDFAELASAHSTDPGTAAAGGDLGYFTRGQMVLPFEEAAFAIAVGEFSRTPVETQFGWHVIKVVDLRGRVPPSFEEVEQGLRQSMRDAAYRAELEKLGLKAQP
jgi:hypothetical protein